MSELSQKAGQYAHKIDEETQGSLHPKTASFQGYLAGYEDCQKEYEDKLRWIPVTEDLPDEDNYTQCLWKNEEGEIWFGMACESQKPTHWKHCFL